MDIKDDYSAKLAALIAQYKVPQAPPPSRVGFVHGGDDFHGGRPGVSANVDVRQIVEAGRDLARLFGWRSAEENEKDVAALSKKMETLDPEEVDRLMMQTNSQMVIEGLEKGGGKVTKHGFYDSGERTPLGARRWSWAKTPGQKLPLEKQYEIGGYGPGPAAQIEQQRIQANAIQASNETAILAKGGEPAATLIRHSAAKKREEALAAETPTDKTYKLALANQADATAKLHDIQSQINEIERKYKPEMIKGDLEHKKRESEYYIAKAAEAKSNSKKLEAEATGLTKEQQGLQRENLRGWDKTVELVNAILPRNKPGDRGQIIKQLSAVTGATIEGTIAATGDSKLAGGPLHYWLGVVMPETMTLLSKKDFSKGGIFSGYAADMEKIGEVQKYAKDAQRFTEMMGAGMTVGATKQALSLIAEIVTRSPITSDSAKVALWAVEYFGKPQLVERVPELKDDLQRLNDWINNKGQPKAATPTTPGQVGPIEGANYGQ